MSHFEAEEVSVWKSAYSSTLGCIVADTVAMNNRCPNCLHALTAKGNCPNYGGRCGFKPAETATNSPAAIERLRRNPAQEALRRAIAKGKPIDWDSIAPPRPTKKD